MVKDDRLALTDWEDAQPEPHTDDQLIDRQRLPADFWSHFYELAAGKDIDTVRAALKFSCGIKRSAPESFDIASKTIAGAKKLKSDLATPPLSEGGNLDTGGGPSEIGGSSETGGKKLEGGSVIDQAGDSNSQVAVSGGRRTSVSIENLSKSVSWRRVKYDSIHIEGTSADPLKMMMSVNFVIGFARLLVWIRLEGVSNLATARARQVKVLFDALASAVFGDGLLREQLYDREYFGSILNLLADHLNAYWPEPSIPFGASLDIRADVVQMAAELLSDTSHDFADFLQGIAAAHDRLVENIDTLRHQVAQFFKLPVSQLTSHLQQLLLSKVDMHSSGSQIHKSFDFCHIPAEIQGVLFDLAQLEASLSEVELRNLNSVGIAVRTQKATIWDQCLSCWSREDHSSLKLEGLIAADIVKEEVQADQQENYGGGAPRDDHDQENVVGGEDRNLAGHRNLADLTRGHNVSSGERTPPPRPISSCAERKDKAAAGSENTRTSGRCGTPDTGAVDVNSGVAGTPSIASVKIENVPNPRLQRTREIISFIKKANTDDALAITNPFVILGVDPLGISETQLRRLKQKVSLLIHPDKLRNESSELVSAASEAFHLFSEAFDNAIRLYRDNEHRHLPCPRVLAPFSRDITPDASEPFSDDDAPLVPPRRNSISVPKISRRPAAATNAPTVALNVRAASAGPLSGGSTGADKGGHSTADKGNNGGRHISPSAKTKSGIQVQSGGGVGDQTPRSRQNLSKFVAQPSKTGSVSCQASAAGKMSTGAAVPSPASNSRTATSRPKIPLITCLRTHCFERLRATDSPVSDLRRTTIPCPLSFRLENLGGNGLSLILGPRRDQESLKTTRTHNQINVYCCYPFAGDLERVGDNHPVRQVSEVQRLATRLAIVGVYESFPTDCDRARLMLDPVPICGGEPAKDRNARKEALEAHWCTWWLGLQVVFGNQPDEQQPNSDQTPKSDQNNEAKHQSSKASVDSLSRINWKLCAAPSDTWVNKAVGSTIRSMLRFYKFSAQSIYDIRMHPTAFSTRALRVTRIEDLLNIVNEVFNETNMCNDRLLLPQSDTEGDES